MRKLLISLLIIASTVTAQAKQATWKQLPLWTVLGDADGPYCSAYSMYRDGTTIHIGRTTAGWTLLLQGVQSTPGQTYRVGMATSGAVGVLYGEGVGDNVVRFDDLSLATVKSLALTPRLAIVGLGNFNMKGSLQAIVETAECYNAVSGRQI